MHSRRAKRLLREILDTIHSGMTAVETPQGDQFTIVSAYLHVNGINVVGVDNGGHLQVANSKGDSFPGFAIFHTNADGSRATGDTTNV